MMEDGVRRSEVFRYLGYGNRVPDEETGELAEELDILMDKHLEIFPQELENSFEAGFKTGAKLMCEIFSEEAETIKRYGSFRDQ